MDEGIVALIREFKYPAICVKDCGLSGKPDENVMAFAWRERRMLVTHDQDFLDDRRFPPHRNPGVVTLPALPLDSDGFLLAFRSSRLIRPFAAVS